MSNFVQILDENVQLFQSRCFEYALGKVGFQPAIRSGVNPEQTVLWKPTVEALKLNIDILYSLGTLNSVRMEVMNTYGCLTLLLPFVFGLALAFFLFHKRISWMSTKLKFMSWRLITVSSIASPICQEGQSERTFLIFPLFINFFLIFALFFLIFSLFSPIFDIFFSVKGALSLPIYWLRHCSQLLAFI